MRILIAKDAKVLDADKEDSDQTARMRSLIRLFFGRTCQKVRFLTLWLISFSSMRFYHSCTDEECFINKLEN